MKGANTTKGNHSGQSFCSQPETPNAPARKPKGIDPASPMKILAGGKLNKRKAAEAAAIDHASRANSLLPASQAASPYVPKPMTAMPPASPSEPSMKLYRFVIQPIASSRTIVI